MEYDFRSCDILVIGGGIAGASAAAMLARDGKTVLLADMEAQPGFHTTGRSAATFVASYGNDVIRALNASSRPFFDAAPAGFSDHPLLSKRGALFIADEQNADSLLADVSTSSTNGLLVELPVSEALELSPILKSEKVAIAAFEANAADIDVNGLLQGYLRWVREAGGRVLMDAGVTGLLRRGGRWEIETRLGMISASVVVNAAGAWADEIAGLAGTQPIGLVPKRRTALTIDPGTPYDSWPLTISADESWYFRPEGAGLLISPADETPSVPCDAQPDEMDIAVCIDRIEQVTSLRISNLIAKRAGLRNFVYDKTPVAGFATDVDGFFWLAGQGGYGIQTAPALAEITAALIGHGTLSTRLVDQGIDAAALSPARLNI